jgi:hypothetical protein
MVNGKDDSSLESYLQSSKTQWMLLIGPRVSVFVKIFEIYLVSFPHSHL